MGSSGLVADDWKAPQVRRRYDRLAGYTTGTVVDLTGLTFRQIDWWTRVGLVTPSYAQAAGSGSVRDWSEEDVAKLRLAKVARESGASLDGVRRWFAAIEALPDGWATRDLFLLVPLGGTPELVDAGWLAARLRHLNRLVRVLHLPGPDEPLTLGEAEG